MASSSKVTVEYHDPAGVFPLISAQLRTRLPLRNLNWKSPTRPLRSIESLHVDLVPSKETANGQPGAATARKVSREADDGKDASTKQRRHQIPGLRQTPYLKVFILRCDDNETYKTIYRKQLREWLKDHVQHSQSTTSSSSAENHDAFEWLILHVVIPNTGAAGQPRYSASSRDSGELKEKLGSSTRWPGRGSTTILEKIRADFNVVGKNAPDRVAQIRLQESDVSPEMMPRNLATPTPSYSESPQENKVAWDDLIAKFKNLILLSFDLRVSQFEEDIREKDSQRTLPGWNFCTFFLLKEGLARGFESVGLVEDALVAYDELSIGLDTAYREQLGNNPLGHTESILYHTKELQQYASVLKSDGASASKKKASLFFPKPIDSNKKDYRELILTSNISIFDFRCYVFSRQRELLLRLGSPQRPQTGLDAKLRSPGDSSQRSSLQSKPLKEVEDLLALAELCRRALSFMALIARIMREDLSRVDDSATRPTSAIIDNLVSSWTFSVAQQILEETITTSIPASLEPGETGASSHKTLSAGAIGGQEPKLQLPEPKTMLHPTRTSSSGAPPYSQVPASGKVVYNNPKYSTSQTILQDSPIGQGTGGGSEDFAAQRAEIYLLQRRVLERAGKNNGWFVGWSSILESRPRDGAELTDVNLDDDASATSDTSEESESRVTEGPKTTGLVNPRLVDAFSSIDAFRTLYEVLSDLAIKHYMTAGHKKSAERIMSDLAVLRFQQGNYSSAAMFFERVSPLFASTAWNYVEAAMLKMQAECLKKLGRRQDYVKAVLLLLEKSSMRGKQSRFPRVGFPPTSLYDNNLQREIPQWLDDEHVNTNGLLTELVALSEGLDEPLQIEMLKYFDNIDPEPHLRHYEDRDGVQLQLQFIHLLEDPITAKSIRIKLLNLGDRHTRDILLQSAEPVAINKGPVKVLLESNMHTFGTYAVERITLEVGKLLFNHEPLKQEGLGNNLISSPPPTDHPSGLSKRHRILSYPRLEAFHAQILPQRSIQIDKPRSVVLECHVGQTDIERVELRLHAATAGLRLRTGTAGILDDKGRIDNRNRSGIIQLSQLSSESIARVQVPYELDNPHREISLWLEATYFIGGKEYSFIAYADIHVDLPLDVNVYDVFKTSALFSRFNIKSANHIPLRIDNIGLSESDYFNVEAPACDLSSAILFPDQPACMTYKITRTEKREQRPKEQAAAQSLRLTVDYSCLNDDILAVVEGRFTNDVRESSLAPYTRLLAPTLINRLKKHLRPNDYVRMGLLNRIEVPSYTILDWDDLLINALPNIRDEMRKWLQQWHSNNPTLSLPSSSPSPRQVLIPVSIPVVHILHTATLSLSLDDSKQNQPTPIVSLSKPILAKLKISHTRHWDPSPRPLPLDFVFELSAPESTWLIGGQKRAHFTADANAEQDFDVILIPLKTGRLLLPGLEIKGSGRGGAGVQCETEYRSYGDAVEVVGDVREVGVKVERMGMGGRVEVVRRRGREEETFA